MLGGTDINDSSIKLMYLHVCVSIYDIIIEVTTGSNYPIYFRSIPDKK